MAAFTEGVQTRLRKYDMAVHEINENHHGDGKHELTLNIFKTLR
jgi:hypothetical protein